jgi:hypothetical protein
MAQRQGTGTQPGLHVWAWDAMEHTARRIHCCGVIAPAHSQVYVTSHILSGAFVANSVISPRANKKNGGWRNLAPNALISASCPWPNFSLFTRIEAPSLDNVSSEWWDPLEAPQKSISNLRLLDITQSAVLLRGNLNIAT